MVKQGDIIKINFNPQKGHEQAGYRPAIVVSNNTFNRVSKLVFVCPITNSIDNFPLHIKLDTRTVTTGIILCEHLRSLDIEARDYKIVEKLPKDILQNVPLLCILYLDASYHQALQALSLPFCQVYHTCHRQGVCHQRKP